MRPYARQTARGTAVAFAEQAAATSPQAQKIWPIPGHPSREFQQGAVATATGVPFKGVRRSDAGTPG